MDRERELLSELIAGGEGPDAAVVSQRRVPGTRGGRRPEWEDVVEPVTVAHYDYVLVEV